MSAWAVKDATKSWDSVFDHAWAGEPQFVSRGGAQTVVVISLQTYETTRSSRRSGLEMFEKLHEDGPVLEDEDMKVFDRVQDCGREVSLA